jgi:hypothetical protein
MTTSFKGWLTSHIGLFLFDKLTVLNPLRALLERRWGMTRSKGCRMPLVGSRQEMTAGTRIAGRDRIASLRGCNCCLTLLSHRCGMSKVYGDCTAQPCVRSLPCMPKWAGSAATPVPTRKVGKDHGASEFPRLAFDPFVELRRMQSEMSRLFSGLRRRPVIFRRSTSGGATTARSDQRTTGGDPGDVTIDRLDDV